MGGYFYIEGYMDYFDIEACSSRCALQSIIMIILYLIYLEFDFCMQTLQTMQSHVCWVFEIVHDCSNAVV